MCIPGFHSLNDLGWRLTGVCGGCLFSTPDDCKPATRTNSSRLQNHPTEQLHSTSNQLWCSREELPTMISHNEIFDYPGFYSHNLGRMLDTEELPSQKIRVEIHSKRREINFMSLAEELASNEMKVEREGDNIIVSGYTSPNFDERHILDIVQKYADDACIIQSRYSDLVQAE